MIEGLLISSEQMTPIHHTGGRQIYSVFRGGGGGDITTTEKPQKAVKFFLYIFRSWELRNSAAHEMLLTFDMCDWTFRFQAKVVRNLIYYCILF
jgi:hypothetical protein